MAFPNINTENLNKIGLGLLAAVGVVVGAAVVTRKPALSRALSACGELPQSSRLYKCAEQELEWNYERGGETPKGLSNVLGVSQRQAERLLQLYGIKEYNARLAKAGALGAKKRWGDER